MMVEMEALSKVELEVLLKAGAALEPEAMA